MANGTAIYDIFHRIPKAPIPTVVDLDLPDDLKHCCNDFFLHVLAESEGGTDENKNDVSGFLWWFSSVVTGVTLTLYKDGVVVETLNNNDFGTFYAYQFKINDLDQNFIGYQLNWFDVLAEHGVGEYKVRCTVTTAIAGMDGYLESPTFCLAPYTPENANGTVKLEYYLKGMMGVNADDEIKVDFEDLNWYNSYRLPGYLFGSPSNEYTTSDVELNTGQRLWVENEKEIEFTLKLKPIPQFIHDILSTDFMQADLRLITDYNNMNPINVVKKKVIPSSGYSPKWEKRELQNKLAPVEVKFKPLFNNFRKLRS